jgi:hypothetical protein
MPIVNLIFEKPHAFRLQENGSYVDVSQTCDQAWRLSGQTSEGRYSLLAFCIHGLIEQKRGAPGCASFYGALLKAKIVRRP